MPADNIVTLRPEIEQIVGVAEESVTARPEVDEGVGAMTNGVELNVRLEMVPKVIA